MRLLVVGVPGHHQAMEAMIATDCTGLLPWPPARVAAGGLSWWCRQPGMLAAGRIASFDVDVATVLWDGQPRTVEVETADTDPLVGMRLLDQHALRIDIRNGGVVTMTALP